MFHHGYGLCTADAGFTPVELSTEAAMTLEADGNGFRIGRSALTLREKCSMSTMRHLLAWQAKRREAVSVEGS
jgi:hypothetical protein